MGWEVVVGVQRQAVYRYRVNYVFIYILQKKLYDYSVYVDIWYSASLLDIWYIL